MKLIKLRGANGLGDACYIYPIAKYLSEQGNNVQIMTKYPSVYEKLNCKTIDRYDGQPDMICRYGSRYPNQETNVFQDTLIVTNLINENIELKIDYNWSEVFKFPTNKKICVIKSPCYAMAKGLNDTACLIPKIEIYQKIINKFKNKCYFVLCGKKNNFEFSLNGIDEDLSDYDNIPRIMALINQVDIVLTQSSYFVSFAESLDTKCHILFASVGLKTSLKFYRFITPKKVIVKHQTTKASIDDEPIENIFNKFERLLDQ